jgi:hypothetical protein
MDLSFRAPYPSIRRMRWAKLSKNPVPLLRILGKLTGGV